MATKIYILRVNGRIVFQSPNIKIVTNHNTVKFNGKGKVETR